MNKTIERETAEMIEILLRDRLTIEKVGRMYGLSKDGAVHRVNKYARGNKELKKALSDLARENRVKNIKGANEKMTSKKAKKVIEYFREQSKISNIDIMNYSIKVNSCTPVVYIIEELESMGKVVARI